MKMRYSGRQSEKFWDRINAVPGRVGLRLYALSCDLQDFEGELASLLDEAESLNESKKKLKKKLRKARKVKRR